MWVIGSDAGLKPSGLLHSAVLTVDRFVDERNEKSMPQLTLFLEEGEPEKQAGADSRPGGRPSWTMMGKMPVSRRATIGVNRLSTDAPELLLPR